MPTNEILQFGTEGTEVSGDVLSLEDYAAHPYRLSGHQVGIARRALENTVLRQVTHMAAGLAQFIANRYAPGVVDDGDLDKIEEGLAEAILTFAVTGYGKDLGLAGQVLSLLSETGATLGQVTLPTITGYGKSLSLAGQVLSLLSETGGPLSQVTLPGNRYESAQQTITSNGLLTLAHGLGAAPWMIQVLLVCITAEAGYSAGEVIYAPGEAGGHQGYSVIADATNIYLKYGSYSSVMEVQHRDTGLDVDLTNSSWRVIVRATA